jgi:hypothetical protein
VLLHGFSGDAGGKRRVRPDGRSPAARSHADRARQPERGEHRGGHAGSLLPARRKAADGTDILFRGQQEGRARGGPSERRAVALAVWGRPPYRGKLHQPGPTRFHRHWNHARGLSCSARGERPGNLDPPGTRPAVRRLDGAARRTLAESDRASEAGSFPGAGPVGDGGNQRQAGDGIPGGKQQTARLRRRDPLRD